MTLERTPEDETVAAATETVAAAAEKTTDAVVEAAATIGQDATVATMTALVGAVDRIAGTQNRVIQLIEGVAQSTQESINGLSRAISNTDVSAQKAAEASETIAETIQPPEESAPDAGEKPAQIEALPRTQAATEKEARETYWFGKAARRHQPRQTAAR